MGRAERTRNAGRSEGGACEDSISAGVPNCGGVHGSQIQAGKGGEIDGKLTEREQKVLESFAVLLPKMTETDLKILEAFGQGMAVTLEGKSA